LAKLQEEKMNIPIFHTDKMSQSPLKNLCFQQFVEFSRPLIIFFLTKNTTLCHEMQCEFIISIKFE